VPIVKGERGMSRYVIVGCGVAGNSAAETIRKLDPDFEIRMFTKEAAFYYYRPALPEYLAGEKVLKAFTLHDGAWYEKNRIDVHLSTEIVCIDPGARTVTTKEGRTFAYDRLLLATGGKASRPDIKGADAPGVFTLRTLEDADAILKRAASAKSVTLIGGGLLGLEAGNGLRKRGLKVTVIERNPRMLPRQMDPAGAQLLQHRMEEMGFSFLLNERTREIVPADGRLTVIFESGNRLDTDMVLFSAGVDPELILARQIGLPVGRAVKVDDRLQAGLEDIFAAGDDIEHRGRYYGSWPAAMAQGRAAGANMAGKGTLYEGTLQANRLKVAGIDLISMGDIDAEGDDECIVRSDEEKCVYRKLVIENNSIAGAILLGDLHGEKEILSAIEGHKDISLVKKTMEEEGFDLSKRK
jgi:nitrite reductase (NADH) large subunit